MSALKRIAVLVTFAATCCAVTAATSTVTLQVSNMVCSMCSSAVSKALLKVPGVEAARVDLDAKQAVVTFDPAKTTPQALTNATAAAGFPSAVRSPSPAQQ